MANDRIPILFISQSLVYNLNEFENHFDYSSFVNVAKPEDSFPPKLSEYQATITVAQHNSKAGNLYLAQFQGAFYSEN